MKFCVKTIAVITCGSPTPIQIQEINYISIMINSFFLTVYYVIDFYEIDNVIV